jgi:tetratricopeptide (TPR) repeat protein
MTKWFQWIVLTSITGSPLASILILLAFWWAVDHFAVGMLPDPLRAWARWQRASRLKDTLLQNPHDRRARLELADIYLQQRRYGKAAELLRANLKAGDDDMTTLFSAGIALCASGDHAEGERLLLRAREREPSFRMNSIDLELGRWRLGRGDVAGAKEALERFCKARPGTVEGKVLLAKVYQKSAEATRAKEMKSAAWRDYASSPWFQRRRDRFWAWRANPSRPAMYAAIMLVAFVLFARYGAPVLAEVAVPPAVEDIGLDE